MPNGGRRIVISGGTRGLGAAAAERLVKEGHLVWIFGQRQSTLEDAMQRIHGLVGGTVCDVTNEHSVREAILEATAELGALDGAFVNAGIGGAEQPTQTLSVKQFRRALDVNVIGSFLFAREAASMMGAGSAIVFNSSVNGLRAEANFADYNASKAAAIALAQTMALELAPAGITVSTICPGYIRAGMAEQYLREPEMVAAFHEKVPAGRLGEAHEVSELVAFLLGGYATFVDGAVITIDGGSSI